MFTCMHTYINTYIHGAESVAWLMANTYLCGDACMSYFHTHIHVCILLNTWWYAYTYARSYTCGYAWSRNVLTTICSRSPYAFIHAFVQLCVHAYNRFFRFELCIYRWRMYVYVTRISVCKHTRVRRFMCTCLKSFCSSLPYIRIHAYVCLCVHACIVDLVQVYMRIIHLCAHAYNHLF